MQKMSPCETYLQMVSASRGIVFESDMLGCLRTPPHRPRRSVGGPRQKGGGEGLWGMDVRDPPVGPSQFATAPTTAIPNEWEAPRRRGGGHGGRAALCAPCGPSQQPRLLRPQALRECGWSAVPQPIPRATAGRGMAFATCP